MKQKHGRYELEWVPLMFSEPMDASDHGVEFHYMRGKSHLVIGFIEGYAWQRGLSNEVRVYYLSPESKEWGKLQSRAVDIIKELENYVHEVLEQKVPVMKKGNMHLGFNG